MITFHGVVVCFSEIEIQTRNYNLLYYLLYIVCVYIGNGYAHTTVRQNAN